LIGLGLLMARGSASAAFSSPAVLAALNEMSLLCLGVFALTASVGVSCAFLTSLYAFPARRWLEIGLILPLAFPTYLAAYLAVDLLDYFGPVQSAWRWLIGASTRADYAFYEIRSLSGAIFVLSLTLFPYVYVPCRVLFAHHGRSMIDAARVLGSSGWALFFKIGLPLAVPGILGGASLALLETLNDIGATQHLGVSSFSLLIRDLWLNRGDLAGAAQLAGLVLLLVFILAMLGRAGRSLKRPPAPMRVIGRARRIPISGAMGWLVSLLVALPVVIGFLIPTVFLIHRAVLYAPQQVIDPEFLKALLSSLLLGAFTTGLVLAAAILLAVAARYDARQTGLTQRLANLGYAIPGTVLVLAFFPLLAVADDAFEALSLPFLLAGSLGALTLVLFVRFLGVGTTQTVLCLNQLSPNVDQVARILGRKRGAIIPAIHLPNLTTGILLGGALVFIDVIKELPATLLMPPLNFETLATRAYAQASAGMFESAAAESLVLLALGFGAVLIVNRYVRAGEQA
jgi:iron(III) transport system permease protein